MNGTLILGIVEILIIIWYILAKKNPQKYAPFLKAPYGKKRGLIFLVAFIICGFIGMAINPQPASPASQQTQQTQQSTEMASKPKEQTSSKEFDAYKKFVSIPMGSDYDTVKNTLGVNGQLKHENEIAGIKSQAYEFKIGSAIAMMTFQTGRLTSKAMDSLSFYKQKGEKITMAEFNQIQIGMSYEQVKEIFKRDGLLKSETNIMGTGSRLISWINSDGSNAIITFGPNGVDSKTQTNLK